MLDLPEIARVKIDDCCGEGVIAFPEIVELLSQASDISNEAAVGAARAALTGYFNEDRVRIFLGHAYAHELTEVGGRNAEIVLADDSHYRYGAEDEARAWFSLEC